MTNPPFPQDFLNYLETHTLTGIKGGTDREKFLDIWMVAVDGRVFARSWQKSNKSWFTAFLDQGIGQIKYDDTVIEVTSKPMNEAQMNLLVDQAYRRKYTQKHNLFYVDGITQPEYHKYTMEFFFEKVIN